jgi:hypothetical protein
MFRPCLTTYLWSDTIVVFLIPMSPEAYRRLLAGVLFLAVVWIVFFILDSIPQEPRLPEGDNTELSAQPDASAVTGAFVSEQRTFD